MKHTVEMASDDMVYLRTKFFGDWFRHLSNSKVITTTV
jgi:hypothetical protein